ncbi:hypothetical protein, partial [Rhizobium pisi]|uniref:hypothetical protein n=1 Tax=Rhizobium pisi TaxID=574561 RepID=UPI003D08F78C
NPIAKKAKPAEKIDGFVSSLEAGFRRAFLFAAFRLLCHHVRDRLVNGFKRAGTAGKTTRKPSPSIF